MRLSSLRDAALIVPQAWGVPILVSQVKTKRSVSVSMSGSKADTKLTLTSCTYLHHHSWLLSNPTTVALVCVFRKKVKYLG